MLLDMALFWLIGLPAVAAFHDALNKTTGNFTNSCSDITIDDIPVLQASCGAGSSEGGNYSTVLDLNLCVGFDHGSRSLAWDNYGKFNEYCNNCSIAYDGKILGCYCDGEKPDDLTLLDLDEGIRNKHGELYCVLWG